jgi:hypothetical protein
MIAQAVLLAYFLLPASSAVAARYGSIFKPQQIALGRCAGK